MYYSIKTKGRNISARVTSNTYGDCGIFGTSSGAFILDSSHPNIGRFTSDTTSSGTTYHGLDFSASRVVPTASDNHPYSMYFVPLITY